MMTNLLIALAMLASQPATPVPAAAAQPVSIPSPPAPVNRTARDGTVRLYGAGGPHTALQKVADLWLRRTGKRVVITAGPEKTWSARAAADADIIWGTSEQSMTAYLQNYRIFTSDMVEPIYIRPAVIAVKKGNPRGIKGFDDLLRPGIRIVVTEGAGVANTSGTGVWEDVAGRHGKLGDVIALRRNIIAYASGSGASLKAFTDQNADAWITWPDWPLTHADTMDMVPLSPDRAIWRDLSIAVAPDADPGARAFANFLLSDDARAIMRSEGWQR